MCGLQGFSGTTNYNVDKLKFLMLWNSVERGRDATGIYTPKTGVIKDNEPAAKFFLGKIIQGLQEDTTLIAHVRAKTVGANLIKNAHPFETDRIVLAHNGTLKEHHRLATEYDIKSADWDVDSQILAIAVNKAFNTAEGTPDVKVLSEYQGAAALLFHDKKEDVLYAWHDKERPLFRGWTVDGGMYISSIAEALQAIECYEVAAFPIDTLIAIKDGQIISEVPYTTYAELHKNDVKAKSSKGRTKDTKFPKLSVNQRSFVSINEVGSNFKPWFLLDFWVKAVIDTEGDYQNAVGVKAAKVTKGKYYLVTGYYDEKQNVVEIIDDRNESCAIFIACLELINIIPQKGDTVIFITNIESVKDKIPVWAEGELAQVTNFDFTRGEVEVYNDYHKKNYLIPLDLLRKATPEEIAGEDQDTPFTEDGSDRPDIEAMLKTMRDTETTDQESDDPTPGNDDEYIDRVLYDALRTRIENEMEDLSNAYDSNQDITGNINDIKATLDFAQDPYNLVTA